MMQAELNPVKNTYWYYPVRQMMNEIDPDYKMSIEQMQAAIAAIHASGQLPAFSHQGLRWMTDKQKMQAIEAYLGFLWRKERRVEKEAARKEAFATFSDFLATMEEAAPFSSAAESLYLHGIGICVDRLFDTGALARCPSCGAFSARLDPRALPSRFSFLCQAPKCDHASGAFATLEEAAADWKNL